MAAKKNNSTLIIAVIAIVVLAAIFFLVFLQEKRYRWNESYEPMDDQPYGTLIFHRLMKEVRSNQTFVMVKDSAFKELPKDPTASVDNYIYIGSEYYANLDDTKQLFDFVAAGNNAYIFCDQPSNMVSDSVLRLTQRALYPYDYYEDEEVTEEEDYEEEEWDEVGVEEYEFQNEMIKKFYSVSDSTIELELSEASVPSIEHYALSKYYHFKKTDKEWSFFHDSLITNNGGRVQQIGFFNGDYPNYITCSFGKGKFYFHSTPLVFTNYHMLSDTAMKYCRETLTSMGTGIVYWDEDNRDWDAFNYNFSDTETDPTKPQEGPMEFILSEPSLKYGWYTLLAAGLLYLLFGARRKQRIIPAVDNMENTSIEYTEVISQMFMNQSDHKKLVMMKMDLFRAYLRDRFNLKLPMSMREEDDKLYRAIAFKCNVNEALIKDIFEQGKFLSSIVVVETAEMLVFHARLEDFYERSK